MQTLDPAAPAAIIYPESDGKPMADNTEQARWIFILYGNIEALFADREDVFVAADSLWYPVEGNNKICQAPDVYVVFGRPKGPRGSYQQWKEGGIPLTVVFEVLSPENTPSEMARKLLFYEEHGVEEYYVYNPETDLLTVYTRGPMGAAFRSRPPATFVSPRMGITFDTSGEELVVRYPDGRPFRTFVDVAAERDRAAAERDRAAAERDRAAAERDRAAAERDRAAAERDEAQRQLDRLRDLTQKALAGSASEEERAELQALMARP